MMPYSNRYSWVNIGSCSMCNDVLPDGTKPEPMNSYRQYHSDKEHMPMYAFSYALRSSRSYCAVRIGIIHLVRPIYYTGNGPCNSLNIRMLTRLLIFAFSFFLRPFFQVRALKFGTVGALNRQKSKFFWYSQNSNFGDYLTHFLAKFIKKALFTR